MRRASRWSDLTGRERKNKPWLNGMPRLIWVIQGGESGPLAHEFHIEWAESLITQCKEHGVPYFLKQLGTNACWKGRRARYSHSHGGNWEEWPKGLRVRQFPKLRAG
jgi:protein gp37